MSALLAVEAVSRRFRGLLAVDGVSFDVAAGEIFAVIGPNGAGKTTLFNLIAGALAPSAGAIRLAGERIDGMRPDAIAARGVGRTFQIVRPFPAMTVRENIMVGSLMRTPHAREARVKAEAVMERMGFSALADRPAGALTLPDRKRLEVARALATEPRLLLLDEVMAGLRPTEVDGMVGVLREINRELVLVLFLRCKVVTPCAGARSLGATGAAAGRGQRPASPVRPRLHHRHMAGL